MTSPAANGRNHQPTNAPMVMMITASVPPPNGTAARRQRCRVVDGPFGEAEAEGSATGLSDLGINFRLRAAATVIERRRLLGGEPRGSIGHSYSEPRCGEASRGVTRKSDGQREQ
jgi:hypothetical protein